MAVTKSVEGEETPAEKNSGNGTQKEKMVPISEVNALIDARLKEMLPQGGNLNDELLRALIKIQSQQKGPEGVYDKTKYVPAETLAGDRMDEPVVFWAPGFSLVLGDDTKNGIPIRSPYGAVKFEAVGENRQQRGKEVDVNLWSKYVCHSKSQLEFLRNHTYFGFRFFEKVGDSIKIDARAIMRLAAHMEAVKNIAQGQVYQIAKDRNLPFMEDLNEMRMAIAKSITDEELIKYEDAQKTRIRDEAREAAMLKQIS